ncbi:membrane protein [Rodentibacter pneumotropicus]|uniref:Membrane protein n=1 Tax=Rodentibacter pneumotropicus TaxID=758 RepID=A0A448MQG1_9PAST|nr:membrane protein [Rodentibacter pneumotropicus]
MMTENKNGDYFIMEKQIFNQYDETMEETFQPKQEFDNVETIEDEPLEGELLDEQFEQAMKPQSKGWKTLLKLTALLFGVATVAQSVQWIWDSFQNRQWIYFAFSLVSLVVVLFGVKEIVGEWRRLVYLKNEKIYNNKADYFGRKVRSKMQMFLQRMVNKVKTLPRNGKKFEIRRPIASYCSMAKPAE